MATGAVGWPWYGFGRIKGDARAQQAGARVLYAVARARRGVVPTPGITVIGAPGAAAAAVMPGVARGVALISFVTYLVSTPGRARDARGVGHPGPATRARSPGVERPPSVPGHGVEP